MSSKLTTIVLLVSITIPLFSAVAYQAYAIHLRSQIAECR